MTNPTSKEQVDCPDPPGMARWLRETATNTRAHSDTDRLAAHVAFRLEQAAGMIEALHGSAEEWMDRYMVASGNLAPTTSPVETTTEPSKYQRAVWFLQDIAALAGSTKRKQAGCEIAAHALAQLGEPRESSEPRRETDDAPTL